MGKLADRGTEGFDCDNTRYLLGFTFTQGSDYSHVQTYFPHVHIPGHVLSHSVMHCDRSPETEKCIWFDVFGARKKFLGCKNSISIWHPPDRDYA